VVSDSGRGTIEFTLLGQPVRLNVDSTQYTYDININVGDRVKLIQGYSTLAINSSGIVQSIIPDYTQDKAVVLFDQVFPDQVMNYPAEADVTSSTVAISVQLPLEILQKK